MRPVLLQCTGAEMRKHANNRSTVFLLAMSLVGSVMIASAPFVLSRGRPEDGVHMWYASYEDHGSVARRAAASDLVVRGRAGEIVSRQIDNGGELVDGGGVPVAIREFRIDEILKGEGHGPTGGIVYIVGFDFGVISVEGISPLGDGEVVVFLDALSDEETPGIEFDGTIYAIVGGNLGIFDVEGLNATQRLAVAEVEPGTGDFRPTVSLDELRRDIDGTAN